MAQRPWTAKAVARQVPIVHDDDDVEPDPANGARVPRCAVCGMPDSREIRGLWCGLMVRLPACERCVRRYNPPDPAQAAETAA